MLAFPCIFLAFPFNVLVCTPIQERSAMQRDHTGELEKVVTDYEKIKINAIRTFERAVKRCG